MTRHDIRIKLHPDTRPRPVVSIPPTTEDATFRHLSYHEQEALAADRDFWREQAYAMMQHISRLEIRSLMSELCLEGADAIGLWQEFDEAMETARLRGVTFEEPTDSPCGSVLVVSSTGGEQ